MCKFNIRRHSVANILQMPLLRRLVAKLPNDMTWDVTVDCDLFKSLESPFILGLVGLAISSTDDKTHKSPDSSEHRQDKVQDIYQRHLP